jgi:hypothetical protein
MWLRNYYNLLSALALGDTTLTSSAQPSDYDPPIRTRRPNGTWDTCGLENIGTGTTYDKMIRTLLSFGKASAFVGTNISLSSWDGIGFLFSTDATPVTYDDYTMTGIIGSGLTLASAGGNITDSSTYNSGTHEYTSSHSYTITNTSASPITINSFGLFCYNWLVYREVLNTPITLDPNDAVVITLDRGGEIYNYTSY